jgi:hypothetical protein
MTKHCPSSSMLPGPLCVAVGWVSMQCLALLLVVVVVLGLVLVAVPGTAIVLLRMLDLGLVILFALPILVVLVVTSGKPRYDKYQKFSAKFSGFG